MLPRLVSNSSAQVILLLQPPEYLGCASLISVVTGMKDCRERL